MVCGQVHTKVQLIKIMSLEKVIKIDQIEIVGDYKAIQVRTATVVTDDGTELSRSFHRHVA